MRHENPHVIRVPSEYKKTVVTTSYWRPGEDYLQKISDSIKCKIEDGDVVTISEKAICTALGNLVDEEHIKANRITRFLARYWMRCVWGYILGPLCHLRRNTIRHCRKYPMKEGSIHKQVVVQHAGLLQALMHSSEGGIDGSNLPYACVSLPLKNAHQTAQKIRSHIKSTLGKDVTVVIVDTDKTYSLRGFHFTPRPKPIKGIHSFGGVLAYTFGRFFRMKQRATPIAIAGSQMTTEEALEIAKIANRSRGVGAGRTIWDMAERFNVPLTAVSWEMLNKLEHKPIVIARLSAPMKGKI